MSEREMGKMSGRSGGSCYERLEHAVRQGDAVDFGDSACELLRSDWAGTARLLVLGNRAFEHGFVRKSLPGKPSTEKKREHRRRTDLFWNSTVPTTFGWSLISDEEHGREFAKAWLAQKRVVPEIVEGGLMSDPARLVAVLKEQRAPFRSKGKWSEKLLPLLRTSGSDEMRTFLWETGVLRDLMTKAEEEIKRHDVLLGRVRCPEAIIVHFAFWLEKLYLELGAEREPTFELTCRQYLEVLDRVLRKHRVLVESPEWLDSSGFERVFKETLKRIPKPGKWAFPELFQAYDRVATVDYLIDMYCRSGWVVRNGEQGLEVGPGSTASWQNWKYDERKYHCVNTLHELPWTGEECGLRDHFGTAAPNPISAAACWEEHTTNRYLMATLGRTRFPLYGGDNAGLDGELAASAFARMSACYRSQFHSFMPELRECPGSSETVSGEQMEVVELRDLQRRIAFTMPVQTRTSDGIAASIRGFIELDDLPTRTVAEMLDLVSFDVAELSFDVAKRRGDREGLHASLLFKTPNHYLLLPRIFCTDIRNVLATRIIKRNVDNNRAYSRWQEGRIAELLQFHGFSVSTSFEDGTPECDVLAYKEGVLLVIEAKLTYTRVSMNSVANHLIELDKGAQQLKKRVDALSRSDAEWPCKLGLSKAPENTEIVPLLVSTLPEYDGNLADGVLKVSLFELEALLLEGRLPMLASAMDCEARMSERLATTVKHEFHERGTMAEALRQEIDAACQQVMQSEAMRAVIEDADLLGPPPASADSILQALRERAVWRVLLGPASDIPPPSYVPLNLGGGREVLYAI